MFTTSWSTDGRVIKQKNVQHLTFLFFLSKRICPGAIKTLLILVAFFQSVFNLSIHDHTQKNMASPQKTTVFKLKHLILGFEAAKIKTKPLSETEGFD